MIGMTEEQFWHSNPCTLAPYSEVYRRKQFEIDKICYRVGCYTYEAISCALSGLGKKPKPFRDKPYMAEEEERHKIENMSEEERLEKVEQIFAMLDSGMKDKAVRKNG